MLPLIIFCISIVLLIIFIKPKWGTFLIWLILFTYPHGWWYYKAFLPFNIGADDLFCVSLFFVVLIRRNILEGVPFRFGYAFWTITSFSIITIIANVAGTLGSGFADRTLLIKDILKLLVYWGLFYAILHCIDDVRDLKIQFTMFSIAAVVGGVIVILHYFYPGQMIHWTNPLALQKLGVVYEARAHGAFLNSNGAGCVLACCLAILATTVRLQKRAISKMVLYGFIGILLIGVLVTKSRSGLMALGGTFMIMAFVGKNKKIAWMVVIAGIVVAIAIPGVRVAFQRRLSDIYITGSGWGSHILGRFDVWKHYFETATTSIYFFGQGHRQGIILNRTESHSFYVSMITVYGIGGFIWAIITFPIFFKKMLLSRKAIDPLVGMVGAGCMWGLIAWLIYGTSSDAISSQYPRYLLFYFIVLIDRVGFLVQQEREFLLQYDDYEEDFETPYDENFEAAYDGIKEAY